jgi:hypothetical protein
MTSPSSPRAGRSTVSTAGEPQRPPDEWLLSISIMEAARRIGLEMVVGHSWRELAMLTNTILADQLAAASPAGPGIRNRLLVSRFDPSVSLDELIGAGPEAVPQSEREGLAEGGVRPLLRDIRDWMWWGHADVCDHYDPCQCGWSEINRRLLAALEPDDADPNRVPPALPAARTSSDSAALASPAHPDEE